jgi:8-oxo-dGTP pyrophosphatase MutT (NUDIX family)
VTIYGVRLRVACYVTRPGPAGPELLVIDHAGDDPANPSGTQVPAGGMLPFEALADAAIREVEEETGVVGLTYLGQVGTVELGLHDEGGPSVTNFAHLQAPSGGERSWRHTVTGDGEDAGMTFSCRWEPLPLPFELAAGQGAFLSAL